MKKLSLTITILKHLRRYNTAMQRFALLFSRALLTPYRLFLLFLMVLSLTLLNVGTARSMRTGSSEYDFASHMLTNLYGEFVPCPEAEIAQINVAWLCATSPLSVIAFENRWNGFMSVQRATFPLTSISRWGQIKLSADSPEVYHGKLYQAEDGRLLVAYKPQDGITLIMIGLIYTESAAPQTATQQAAQPATTPALPSAYPQDPAPTPDTLSTNTNTSNPSSPTANPVSTPAPTSVPDTATDTATGVVLDTDDDWDPLSVLQQALEESQAPSPSTIGNSVEDGWSAGPQTLLVDDVLFTLAQARLEVDSARLMNEFDYGLAPQTSREGARFFMPSLCEGCGGRIFSFDSLADMKEMWSFYHELGQQSSALASHLFVHGNILMQLNGSLPPDQAEGYGLSLQNIE